MTARRSTTGDKAGKAKARGAGNTKTGKTTKARRRNDPPVTRHKRTSLSDVEAQLELRTKQLEEALERQTATADVLRIISQSLTNVQPVFDALVLTAVRLLHCDVAYFLRCDGATYSAVTLGTPEGLLADPGPKNAPVDPKADFQSRAIVEKQVKHLPDWSIVELPEFERRMRERWGINAGLLVPLLRDDECIGLFALARKQAGSFSDNDIALAKSFADQALIAIENVRLFNETREALARQTATSDILRVISQSPTDVQPVFDAIVETAVRLLGCDLAFILRCDETTYTQAAVASLHGKLALDTTRIPIDPSLNFPSRAIVARQMLHLPDWSRIELPDHARSIRERYGVSSALYLPLLRDDQCIGVLTLNDRRSGIFNDSVIALAESFRDQALIAIENVRLFNETREALEQQTATAEVLGVINSSPGDLGPVFDAMLERATRLSEAAFGMLWTYDNESFHAVASHRVPQRYAEFLFANPFRPGVNPHSPNALTALHRLARGEDLVRIDDVSVAPGYRSGDPRSRALVELGRARSYAAIALRKDGRLLGGIAVYRQEVRPFNDKQISLLQTFAGQAVIAIENTRLLKELRERTDQVAELNRGLEARVAEQVEELGRVGRLKRFLAPQLAELIVSQGDERILESHRREIVVVFCDLRGFTAFSETAEPEEVLDFLREYHGALGPLVSQFEGTLDQFSGDGIMVFFNDPVPIPDPAERAVKMAVAMREAASSLTAAWRKRGRELGFGAGIAQGYATLGQIGFSERSGYTAIGTVCNVAARLCGEAKDGQILLSQRVNVALKGSVVTEHFGTLVLKGLTQPVVAYNVPLTASQPALRVIDGGNH